MKHVNRERIKSIVLIALFVISLIQVGILWSKQSHRLPISFLTGIFARPQVPVSDVMTRDELFIPYRLVISNGESSHWVLDKKNPAYNPLWDEVKSYLSDIADGNLPLSAAGMTNWGEITSKKGFAFNFKIEIKPDLLRWFLGKPNSAADVPSIYKIMVLPDSINENVNTMYICDLNGKVYKYQPRDYKRKKSFFDILSTFDGNQNTYREYMTMHDSNLESQLNVAPDALYVATQPPYWPYSTISCFVPDSVKNEDGLAEALLGNQKERYQKSNYEDGTIQFNIKENLFKIFPDGVLEFKNFSEPDSGSGENVGTALLNAYGFIKKAASLTDSRADIFLSGLKFANGRYTFTFDYMINGYPVYVDLASANSGDKPTTYAITIEANSKRVLYCKYIIRNFAPAAKHNYHDRFGEIMADSEFKYRQIHIKDMGVSYVINSVEDKQLEPYMVLENDGTPGLITKKLPEQKGD